MKKRYTIGAELAIYIHHIRGMELLEPIKRARVCLAPYNSLPVILPCVCLSVYRSVYNLGHLKEPDVS